uniref:Reverse transcriptase domain-containing protein n=1 Tax=Monopterus albus TaxID=43700 RepID=A0A3Q3IY17_MONAL
MAADSGHYTVLVLLDLTSAFDTVDHGIFMDQPQFELGFSGSVLQWFSSYLSYQTFNVAINVLSDVAGLSCGVPQGSVLGPILFLLHIYISSWSDYYLYADDVQMYCSFRVSFLAILLECLSSIKNWFNNNFLHINPNKTEVKVKRAWFILREAGLSHWLA